MKKITFITLLYQAFRLDSSDFSSRIQVHATQTKKGNPRYHFAKKIDESTSEDKLPKGYEVYEEPNSKVYARKKTKAMLNPAEISIISDGMKKYSEVSDFKLDIKKNIVSIYTNESIEEDSLLPLKHKYYEAKMRFIPEQPSVRLPLQNNENIKLFKWE